MEEVETSCLPTLASLRGVRAGAVWAVLASRHDRRFVKPEDKEVAKRRCVSVGLEPFESLARLDRERGARRYWYPGLRNGEETVAE